MYSNTTLAEKAILISLSLPMPGQRRNDKKLTQEVKTQHGLGQDAGKWDTVLYPKEALAPIKALNEEIREYHHKVTRYFEEGVRILPGPLVMEHTAEMGKFKIQREVLVQSHFLNQYDRWVAWAREQHNGTFNEKDYPGVEKIAKKFKFIVTPMPIPETEQFTESMRLLLGHDAESTDARVREAIKEAQVELVNRLAEPVRDMVRQLQQCPQPNSTMLVRLREIVELAPKLDLVGDPQIAQFVKEMEPLLVPTLDKLRDVKAVRELVRDEASKMLKKLEGYSL